MFSLQNGGELPKVVEREFDNFFSRLRKFLITPAGQHNADGTHTGITYTGPVSSITVIDGIVTDITP